MKVVSLGECMLEVTVLNCPNALFGFGGDTFNTAYYLTQLRVDCAYATALGDDDQSQWLLQQWSEIGIDTQLVRKIANKSPGIYSIQTDASGERKFNYWRNNSAAKSLFNNFDLAQWLEQFDEVNLFYCSLISIAILEQQGRENLIRLLVALKAKGILIAFDNNYRSVLWPDRNCALYWLAKILPFVDIYLPSLSDEVTLYNLKDSQIIEHFNALNIADIIVKNGAQSCTLIELGAHSSLQFDHLTPLDTTAAGDSFNAGYLAAKLHGYDSQKAAKVAHQLAAQVIMHPGALVSSTLLDLALFPSIAPNSPLIRR